MNPLSDIAFFGVEFHAHFYGFSTIGGVGDEVYPVVCER